MAGFQLSTLKISSRQESLALTKVIPHSHVRRETSRVFTRFFATSIAVPTIAMRVRLAECESIYEFWAMGGVEAMDASQVLNNGAEIL
jgi:hypothetical protein